MALGSTTALVSAVDPTILAGIGDASGPVGEELLATVGEAEAAKFGRGQCKVWVRFAPSDLLLFDAASGQRLLPQVH